MLARILRPKHVAWSSASLPHRAFTCSTSFLRRQLVFEGRTTNDDKEHNPFASSPFFFETAYSVFAKRPSRPFPPPFLSTPSHSFSDPLTTHQHLRDRRPKVEGELIRGITNGDDAVIIGGQNFLGVNDGVGAWAQKERGHAALWSRLIAHFWTEEIEKLYTTDIKLEDLDMIGCLQRAYDSTKLVTSKDEEHGRMEILGTTTASSALLHYRSKDQPVILATNLGDCAVIIIRPGNDDAIYKTEEQWHWFDCPRQLGTNSPDTPVGNAKMDVVDVKEGDVVVVASDGCTDNLWETEIIQKVTEAFEKWQKGDSEAQDGALYIARTLMEAAKEVATDPNAESPYMERALDEGLAISEGGKLDDISVVVGVCRKR